MVVHRVRNAVIRVQSPVSPRDTEMLAWALAMEMSGKGERIPSVPAILPVLYTNGIRRP